MNLGDNNMNLYNAENVNLEFNVVLNIFFELEIAPVAEDQRGF